MDRDLHGHRLQGSDLRHGCAGELADTLQRAESVIPQKAGPCLTDPQIGSLFSEQLAARAVSIFARTKRKPLRDQTNDSERDLSARHLYDSRLAIRSRRPHGAIINAVAKGRDHRGQRFRKRGFDEWRALGRSLLRIERQHRDRTCRCTRQHRLLDDEREHRAQRISRR